MEENLNVTGADVGALAEEVGKLMLREPELTAEVQQLKEENARIQENCAAVSCLYLAFVYL
jgi:regulator of replication initiation timing